ncbi:hypothetical protein NQ318_001655 [Aromia moschata]|uniref:Uncharacterized protein n=1 Tax=Aromia moschata TaxID=1265417 RepID=A0AAV8X255_9CUCU|nr:hypothetical protein NQ318_001655 [Aromia moschata]
MGQRSAVPMGTYKQKTEVKPFTPELFHRAQELVREGLSIRRAAEVLGFNEATVRKRLKKGYGVRKLGRFRSVFSNEQEVEIVAHCKQLNKRFYGISVQISPKTSVARTMGFNRVQIGHFFENLKEAYEKYGFTPDRIFNVDETGIQTVPGKLPKLYQTLGKRSLKEPIKLSPSTSSLNHLRATMIKLLTIGNLRTQGRQLPCMTEEDFLPSEVTEQNLDDMDEEHTVITFPGDDEPTANPEPSLVDQFSDDLVEEPPAIPGPSHIGEEPLPFLDHPTLVKSPLPFLDHRALNILPFQHPASQLLTSQLKVDSGSSSQSNTEISLHDDSLDDISLEVEDSEGEENEEIVTGGYALVKVHGKKSFRFFHRYGIRIRREKEMTWAEISESEDGAELNNNGFKLNDYVIVKYDGHYYPGQIKDIHDEQYHISAMLPSGSDWKMACFRGYNVYQKDDVIMTIGIPIAKNKRGAMTVPEMEQYLLVTHVGQVVDEQGKTKDGSTQGKCRRKHFGNRQPGGLSWDDHSGARLSNVVCGPDREACLNWPAYEEHTLSNKPTVKPVIPGDLRKKQNTSSDGNSPTNEAAVELNTDHDSDVSVSTQGTTEEISAGIKSIGLQREKLSGAQKRKLRKAEKNCCGHMDQGKAWEKIRSDGQPSRPPRDRKEPREKASQGVGEGRKRPRDDSKPPPPPQASKKSRSVKPTGPYSEAVSGFRMAVIDRRHPDTSLDQGQADLIQNQIVNILDNTPSGNLANDDGRSSGESLGRRADVTVVESKDLPKRPRVLVFVAGPEETE